jgi:hypothetical protein
VSSVSRGTVSGSAFARERSCSSGVRFAAGCVRSAAIRARATPAAHTHSITRIGSPSSAPSARSAATCAAFEKVRPSRNTGNSGRVRRRWAAAANTARMAMSSWSAE